MDFKESGFMYIIALAVVAFVIVQSLFFIVKSWKHAKEIGITSEKLKKTVVTSILFTIAPSIAILVTVIALANALGLVLPWIRLSVIGNLAYETVAAETVLQAMGSSLATEVTDPQAFSTVAWVMTIGSISPLILLPFLCKFLQKKIGNVANKSESSKKLSDILSAAAFIGIISAFIARAVVGVSDDASNAGVLSVSVLLVSIVTMVILDLLCKKYKLSKFEPFAMPLSMFVGMGAAILIDKFVPFSDIVWRTLG